jgi:hypothetical protein
MSSRSAHSGVLTFGYRGRHLSGFLLSGIVSLVRRNLRWWDGNFGGLSSVGVMMHTATE